jgi:3-dehydroquinate dehydratase-2
MSAIETNRRGTKTGDQGNMRSTSLIYLLEAASFPVRPTVDARASYASIASVGRRLVGYADDLELRCCIRSCGTETELLARIREAGEVASGLIVNAGGYASTSTALRAALSTLRLPVIEVRLDTSDYCGQATASLISDVVTGAIHGLGVIGYELAIDALGAVLRTKNEARKRRHESVVEDLMSRDRQGAWNAQWQKSGK